MNTFRHRTKTGVLALLCCSIAMVASADEEASEVAENLHQFVADIDGAQAERAAEHIVLLGNSYNDVLMAQLVESIKKRAEYRQHHHAVGEAVLVHTQGVWSIAVYRVSEQVTLQSGAVVIQEKTYISHFFKIAGHWMYVAEGTLPDSGDAFWTRETRTAYQNLQKWKTRLLNSQNWSEEPLIAVTK